VEQPLVSVLVTVYNQGKYVRETLESVVGQTCHDWEMIVTDDHSSDKSWEEIQKVEDQRIRRVLRPVNSGLANIPRNEMIRAAKGKYVAFLDGDDVWLPKKLERQVRFMEDNPDYPFSHVACMVVDADGKDLYVRNGGRYPANGDCFRALMAKCFICTSTVMVRRDFLEKVGLFSEERCLRNNGDDTEFFLRCARKGKIGMPSADVLARYRWDNQSLTHHPSRWKPGLDLLVRQDLWEGKMTRKEVRALIWQTHAEQGYLHRKKHNWTAVRWYGARMLCLYPWRLNGMAHLLAGILHRS
jgi:teichuronic acid biosynthesis glycosyltransferase TuaG